MSRTHIHKYGHKYGHPARVIAAAMVSTVLSCSSGGYSALPVDPGDGGLADGQLSGAVYIESISPSRGPSAGGLQLTLRGTGFAPQSTVRVAGQASPKVAFVSDKELLVTLPPAPGRIGLVLVEVITPSGKVTGRADLFSYYSTGLAFAPATSYLSGLKPVGIAASDLNGDGKPDLVSANNSDGSVSVFLGKGDGTVAPAQSIAAGSRPNAVLISEISGDKFADLILPRQNANGLSILQGKGDGTFQAFREVASQISVSAAISDISGDGKPDVVLAGRTGLTDGVFLQVGKGDGTFAAGPATAVSATTASVASADFNGDGKPDVAVSQLEIGQIAVLLNQGASKLGNQRNLSVGNSPFGLLTADWNKDGFADLVASNNGSGTVSLLLGKGDGTFGTASTYSCGSGPEGLATADLNMDGNLDLIVTGQMGSIGVLLGKESGGFATLQTFPASGTPTSAAVTDLDGNQLPDIVYVSPSGSIVGVLLGRAL